MTKALAAEAVQTSRLEVETVFGEGTLPRSYVAPTLVPSQVGNGASFVPIETFTGNADLFEDYLVPFVLAPTKENALYQKLKTNAAFAGIIAEEKAEQVATSVPPVRHWR